MALIAGIATIFITRAAARQQVVAANRQTEAVKEQNTDLRRRHDDEFRPICVFTPYDGVDPWHKRDTLLAICHDPPAVPGFGMIELRCSVRNVGSGPALNISVRFRFWDMGGYMTAPWELSPLYPGECRGGKNDPLHIPIRLGDRFNDADFSQIVGKAWELVLVYDDVFGNSFYSLHHKNPIQRDKYFSAQPVAVPQSWVTIGRGELPE